MNNLPIKLFSASAGSGKTYTLTLEYIKLALSTEDPKGYFRKILGVTFTNKAAGEMKNRIIQSLHLIAQKPLLEKSNQTDLNKSNELISRILSDFEKDGVNITEVELILRAEKTLNLILQDYGLFSVLTIDSFVQKLSQSFIEELNLPDQFEVNLDQKQLLNDVINEILDQINTSENPALKDALLNFSISEVEEDRSWNGLRKSLIDFLNVLFKEDYLEREKEISNFTFEDILQIEKNINEYYKNTVAHLTQNCLQVNQIISQHHLALEDFAHGKNGPISAMLKYLTEPQLENKEYANFDKVLESNSWTGSKASKQSKAQIEQFANDFHQLVSQFIFDYRVASKKYGLLALIKKHLKKFALLNLFQKNLQNYQHENGIISISEFSKKINQVIANDPIPFIYEKLGNRYNHILIDEFQDTSLLQWVNFMPLIDHTTSFYHKSLIVGDAKQSIYKFRGGEVGLIASLFEKSTLQIESKLSNDSLNIERMNSIINHLEPQNLGSNYRSSNEIVNNNNAFFEFIHSKTEIAEKYPLLNKVYAKYVSQEPKAGLKEQSNIKIGFYTVSDEFPLNRDLEYEWTLKYVNNIISESLNKKYQYRDIAILTRGNKEANKLAVDLKKNHPITSSDSLLLHFAPSIRNIIAFLKYLLNPTSKIKQFEWQNTLNVIIQDKEKANGIKVKSFQKLSLKTIVIEYVDLFGLLKIDSEIAYILKFLDFLDEFLLQKSNDIEAFLEYFEQHKNSLSISGSSSSNAITISTIHKSKGLEYPIVILPFTNWAFLSKDGNTWIDTSDIESLDELKVNNKTLNSHFLPINSSIYQDFESLEEQKTREDEIATLEAINVLYVAMTRPVNDLYILSRVVKNSTNKKVLNAFNDSVSSILYSYCKEFNFNSDEKDLEEWFVISHSEVKNDEKESNLASEFPVKLNQFTISETPKLRESKFRNEPYTNTSERIDIGTFIHELVSKNTKEDLVPLLEKFKLKLDTKFHPIIDGLLNLLNTQEHSILFDLNKSILNEQEIVDAEGTIYRPDRVSKLNDTFVVIDYKTGKESAKHLEQIKNYKQKLIELGMSPVVGKIVYMSESRVENV